MNFRNTLILLIIFAILGGSYFIFFRGKEFVGETEKQKDISETYVIKHDEIQKIRLSFKDELLKPYSIAKDTDDKWKIVEPIEAKADEDKVDDLLDDLLNKKIKRRLKESGFDTPSATQPKDLAKFGLDAPTVQIELWTTGEEPYKTFLIGKETVSYSVYAKEIADSDVITIESSALTDFDKSYTDLRNRVVMSFSQGDVNELSLSYPDRTPLICKKDAEGTWMLGLSAKRIETMDSPVQAKADKTEINNLLDALKSLKVGVFESEEAGDLAKFGLDKPCIEAIISIGEGSDVSPYRQQKLFVGKDVPDANRVYVKRDAGDSIYSVTKDIAAKLTRKEYDLRDKLIIAFQRTEVNKFEIKKGNATITCEKDEKSDWKITKPVEIKADKAAVDDVLFELDSLKAQRFASDAPEELSTYGLDKPQIEVSLYEASQTEPKTLLFGKKEGSLVYVKDKDANTVSLVKDKIFKKLNEGVAGLRDKVVVKFESDDAVKLELKHGDVNITCVKTGVNWRITSPVDESADNSKVNNIIGELDELKASKFFADKPDIATTGLDKPEVQVTVTLKDDTTHEFFIGKAIGDGNVYAKLKEEIFSLKDSIVDKLKIKVDDLREKK